MSNYFIKIPFIPFFVSQIQIAVSEAKLKFKEMKRIIEDHTLVKKLYNTYSSIVYIFLNFRLKSKMSN